MKKKTWIVATVLALAILLLPYNIAHLKDGGSKRFQSLTYEVTKVHRMADAGYEDGWIVKILGFEVYREIH